jgi:phage terminase large subunit-like protein
MRNPVKVARCALGWHRWRAIKIGEEKARQSRKIDGLVASVIAHSRAVYAKPKKTALMTSNPW